MLKNVRIVLSEEVLQLEINGMVVGPGPGVWETEEGPDES